jgi:hypothetical protein
MNFQELNKKNSSNDNSYPIYIEKTK